MTPEELQALITSDETAANFVKTLVSKEVETQVSGLKSKNEELLNEKKSLQAKLTGIPTPEEFEEFKKMKAQLESSEDARLIAQGKMDEVILKRTERVRADFETKLVETSTELSKAKEFNNHISQQFNAYVVEDNLRKEAIAAGVLPHALDDAVRRAAGIFSMDTDKTIVARDKDGNLISRDGKTLTPKLFVESLKETAPHFWPASKGSGLVGFTGEGDDAALLKLADQGDMTSYMNRRRKQKSGA